MSKTPTDPQRLLEILERHPELTADILRKRAGKVEGLAPTLASSERDKNIEVRSEEAEFLRDLADKIDPPGPESK